MTAANLHPTLPLAYPVYPIPSPPVALDADRTSHQRKHWAIWDEGGKYTDVIVELMSTVGDRS